MKKGMRVSLIVTTYDSPSILKKVTDSIIEQTKPPDEVIIADDGSDEQTEQVIKEFSETASFPVLHAWHEHKGFRAAKIRNEAIKQSKNNYIILLDGDCIVNRHFISDHLFLAEEKSFVQGKRILVNRNAVAIFNHKLANSKSSLFRLALGGKISNIHHLIRLPHTFSIKNKRLGEIKSCNMSFFKKDIVAVNGFNEDFLGWGNEDSELACRFFKYGLLKKTHPFMAICFHIWHPMNKTISDENKQLLMKAVISDDYTCQNGLKKLKQSVNSHFSMTDNMTSVQ